LLALLTPPGGAGRTRPVGRRTRAYACVSCTTMLGRNSITLFEPRSGASGAHAEGQTTPFSYATMLRRDPPPRARARESEPHGTRPPTRSMQAAISIHTCLYTQHPYTPQEHCSAQHPNSETHRAPGLAHPDPAEPAITTWGPDRVPPPGLPCWQAT
jgi:hypothetical protein